MGLYNFIKKTSGIKIRILLLVFKHFQRIKPIKTDHFELFLKTDLNQRLYCSSLRSQNDSNVHLIHYSAEYQFSLYLLEVKRKSVKKITLNGLQHQFYFK